MNILLLEDTKTDAEFIIHSIKKNYPSGIIRHAVNLKEARELLHSSIIFDIALLDMQLPDGNGIDILLEIRQKEIDTAVAMLTGSGNEEIAVAALKAGADDYLVKKADYQHILPQTIEFALENHKEFLERSSTEVKVLYVEHNPADIDLTMRHLARYAPFIVLKNVHSAEIALKQLTIEGKLQMLQFDVILMDYRLPGLNALEFIKIIRQERKLDIPIIIVSGQANEEVAVQALKLGASEYLTKRKNYLYRLPSLILSAYQHIELKRKQAALTESEARYRLLAENSGDVIFTLDFDLNFTYVSPAVLKLRGFTVDEVLQQNIAQTLTPDSLNKVKLLLDKMLPDTLGGNQLPEPVVTELQTYKKDNTLIWVEVTATALTNDKGKPTGILGVTRDISKRKEAQDELRKLSRAVMQSPDSIIITNKGGKIEYVNPKFTQLTGYNQDEVLGKNPRILNSGEQPKSYYKELWDTILAGKDWSGEFRNIKKNGELYWESASISSLENETGDITHFVAVKEDITERKKSEELLKFHSELQELLLKIASKYINVRPFDFEESLLESLKEMGLFAKADRAYIFEYHWKNQTATNTVEWCAEQITPQKKSLQQIPLTNFSSWVAKHRKGEEIFIFDSHSLSEKSDLRKLLEEQEIKSVSTYPMMKGNECLGFVGFDWLKKQHTYSESEQILLRIFAQMLVNVKNRISLEKNLIIEKEKAEAANRLKTAFLNNISHEVRTPLNGILGFGEMIAQPGISEKDKAAYLKILDKSSRRLTKTITDFMDISLIVSKNVEVNKKLFDLHEVLQTLYEEHNGEANEKGLELRLETGNSKIAQIDTDSELLKKILSHLLDNAVKFTKSGAIKFGYHNKNKQIEFYVRDSGTGMEQEKINTIFDFFSQGEIGLSRGYEGSGLGLSIAKGLVELLDGKITLESEKMKGTTVCFTLPCHCVPEETEHEIPGNLYRHVAGNVVLIAEDESVNCMYIETILNGAGIQFISVKDGQQAVDKCRENPGIGVVLMDLKMPVMDGYEATRQIKIVNPVLSVIAITAQAMQGDREKAIQAGCDDYISKPFDKANLLVKVKQYLIKE